MVGRGGFEAKGNGGAKRMPRTKPTDRAFSGVLGVRPQHRLQARHIHHVASHGLGKSPLPDAPGKWRASEGPKEVSRQGVSFQAASRWTGSKPASRMRRRLLLIVAVAL